MYECTFCNLSFDIKHSLVLHQKTKKCILHRHIDFRCTKCFQVIVGYDNILHHTTICQEEINSDLGMIQALMKQLSLKYEISLQMKDNQLEGTISFKRLYNYNHPKQLNCGITIPLKLNIFDKLKLYTDEQILGSHNHYLNDIFNKISRLEEPFKFLSLKYNFEKFMNIIWLNTSMSCLYFKDNSLYTLGKIQCQNSENKSWFGDTFNLKEDEKIIKCIWYKDPQMKYFYSYLKPLLKGLLNLYLDFCGKILKQKKIKLKATLDLKEKYKIISQIIDEFNLINLVQNIQILDCYKTFFLIFKNLLKNNGFILHTNIEHVFKDKCLPYPLIFEEYSLMVMNDQKFTDENYKYLLDYILPDSEKNIFRTKQ